MRPRKRVVPGHAAASGEPYPAPRWRSALVRPRRLPPAPPGSAGTSAAPAAAPAPGVDLSVDLAPERPGGLHLRNPLLAAAGTFGYGVEYAELLDLERLGAIGARGTTLRARGGNPPPRVAEPAGGLLNGVGLQNPGVDAVIERLAPVWAAWAVPVVVNIAADSVEDFVALARRLDGVPGGAGLELNLSCPNAARAGLLFGLERETAAGLTAAVRRATDLPLVVKLAAQAGDVPAIAKAVEEAGADAISAVNTFPGLALDRPARRPVLGSVYGGLSGPALKPIALRVVYEVAQAVRLPIVAAGGVAELDDVLDYLAAGASAVAVGTALFADPARAADLADQLAARSAAEGRASHRDLIGAALPAPRGARGAPEHPRRRIPPLMPAGRGSA